ncbi:MAG TPA: hypothetical protein VN673_03825 [Clostridia bacterium]|nr:hypothetical protein [Clostridia bacterium]
MKTPNNYRTSWLRPILTLTCIASLIPNCLAQTVVTWGSNNYGQGIVPASATNVVAVSAGSTYNLALRADGTVVTWGSGYPIPLAATNVAAIASGLRHNVALKSNGTVVAWGDNSFQQTQVPVTATNVVAIAAGYDHTLALRADGTVVAWGKGNYGQTNVPFATTNIVAISAGAGHSMAIRADGSAMIWGRSRSWTPPTGYPPYRFSPPLPVDDVTMVSAGAWHNLALRGDGSVTTWGLGAPVPNDLPRVVSVCAGTNYDLAITPDGSLTAWSGWAGTNGPSVLTNIPPNATNLLMVSASLTHGVALQATGFGPRILGPINYRNWAMEHTTLPLSCRALGEQPLHYQWYADGLPISGATGPFPDLPAVWGQDHVGYFVVVSNAVGVVTSSVAKVAVRNVLAWGSNSQGQRNIPEMADRPVAVSAGAFHALALTAKGTVTAWGKNTDGQASVPDEATNVVTIAAGSDHSLALTREGRVLAWGRNWHGQTSVPVSATNVLAVSAGWGHSMALRGDGTVLSWGSNEYGQLTGSLLATEVTAISAGYYHSMVLRADGTVATWGWDYPTPPSATNIIAIAAGWEHCIALRNDGTVVAWGDNKFGQSNVPASATNVVSISAGYYHNMALRADGTVIAWGAKFNSVTNVPALAPVSAVAAGEDFSLALAALAAPQIAPTLSRLVIGLNGLIKLSPTVSGEGPLSFQWFKDGQEVAGGTNAVLEIAGASPAQAGTYLLVASNSLGQATSQPIEVIVQSQGAAAVLGGWGNAKGDVLVNTHLAPAPKAIAAGAFHALALNADGTVTAWGKNTEGQTSIPESVTNVVAIAAGGDHSLALTAEGSLVAWGRDWDGQTNIPPQAVNVQKIACGWAHNLALLSDGTVLAWGNNDLGQTNVPAFNSRAKAIAAGYYHSVALLENGTLVSWGLQPYVPPFATNISRISSGWWHTLALRPDGTVLAWGDNSYGQCTVPPSATNLVDVAAGWFASYGLRQDGTIISWGKNYYGLTNVPTGLKNVSKFAAGEEYVLALVEPSAPRLLESLRDLTTHVGASVYFDATATGSQPLSYQWFHENQLISGATDRVLQISSAQMSDGGTYTAKVMNELGQADTQSAELIIDPRPGILFSGALQVVATGDAIRLSPIVYGAGTFQWLFKGTPLQDGGRVSGSGTQTLAISDARPSDSGDYSLVVVNTFGSSTGTVSIDVCSVLGWGHNGAGQISIPSEATNVVAISAANDHSLALRSDGSVIAWGDNSFGQNLVPASLTNAVAISDSINHSLALRADGSVVAWGHPFLTSVSPLATNLVAIAAANPLSMGLRADGTVVQWPYNHPAFSQLTDVVAIAGLSPINAALRADGTVVSTYYPAPPSATNIAAIAVGSRHVVGLRRDGSVTAWGDNSYGQTDVPLFLQPVLGVAAGDFYSLALLADGSVTVWGGDFFDLPWIPSHITNMCAISAGQDHCLALARSAFSTTPAFDRTAMPGEAVLFTAGVPGVPASYQWQFNGLDILGATNASLLLPRAFWIHSGDYRVVISNAFGVVIGDSSRLTVNRLPLTLHVSPPSETPDGFKLRVSGTSGAGPLVIYSSTNLTHWTPAFTNSITVDPVDYTDPPTTDGLPKFFRAVEGVD